MRRAESRSRHRTVGWLLLLVLLVGAAPFAPDPPHQTSSSLRAEVGAEPRIVDEHGRQVLLRGVNVVQLGDYHQADPDRPPTLPLTEDDFAEIATLGFNVVRLVLNWSALEPTPGAASEAYFARIGQAIDWARAHDVHIVLDMHQDAWSRHIATGPRENCPPGFTPDVGWDGAPAWATFTDGLSTCKLQQRELSPAVAQAFQSFWLDRPAPDGIGIQTHLVDLWGTLAERFGADPVVAGYDLLNEPHPGYTVGATDVGFLAAYYRRAIEAIRTGERAAGADLPKPAFIEPIVTWSAAAVAPPPAPGFTDDDSIVFAPHLYAGSFTVTPGIGISEGFDLAAAVATSHRATFWSGEWGWFGDPTGDGARVAAYAQQEDDHVVGGAWWSWKQACGDPHNHRNPRRPGARLSPSLNRYRCPGNEPLGIPDAFARILSRPYPRAAPGIIEELDSDPTTGRLHLQGDARGATGAPADLWVPDRSHPQPPLVTGTNIDHVRVHPVPGGYRIQVDVDGDYTIEIRPRQPNRR